MISRDNCQNKNPLNKSLQVQRELLNKKHVDSRLEAHFKDRVHGKDHLFNEVTEGISSLSQSLLNQR